MTLTKPIILILGATGRTGSHLVKLLELSGAENFLASQSSLNLRKQ